MPLLSPRSSYSDGGGGSRRSFGVRRSVSKGSSKTGSSEEERQPLAEASTLSAEKSIFAGATGAVTEEMTRAAVKLQAHTRALLDRKSVVSVPDLFTKSKEPEAVSRSQSLEKHLEDRAAAKLQAAARGTKDRKRFNPFRKRAASAPAGLTATEEEQNAATKMQAAARGRFARRPTSISSPKKSGRLSMGNPLSSILNAKTIAANKANQAMVRARSRATVRALRMVVKGILDGMADGDPWTPKADQDKMRADYLWLLHETLRRMEAKELEVKGVGSARLRHVIKKDLMVSSWPPPPPAKPPTLGWLRAKVLYALFPADKHSAYFMNVDKSGMVPLALLWFPFFGVSTLAWLVLFVFIVVVDDQYQLAQYVWSFRVYALVVWGFLPIFRSHFNAFFCSTDPTPERGNGAFCSGAHGWLWETRLFMLNWLLCYVVFGLYLAVRAQQLKSRKPINKLLYEKEESDSSSSSSDSDGPSSSSSSSSSDEEGLSRAEARRIRGRAPVARATGNELAAVMKFDVVATALLFVVAHLDLTYRVHGATDVFAFFWTWVTPYDAADTHAVVHFEFQASVLGLIALPWLLFVIPFVGEMLHQMRITGFDQEGHLRLWLEPYQMRDKWDDEVEERQEKERKEDKSREAERERRERQAAKYKHKRQTLKERVKKKRAASDPTEMV